MDGKLVRDRIPEIIEATGQQVVTRRLGADERLPALFDKLDEEVEELRGADDASRLEELADVYEVFVHIAAEYGHDFDSVRAAAIAKRTERGSFDKGIWMAMG